MAGTATCGHSHLFAVILSQTQSNLIQPNPTPPPPLDLPPLWALTPGRVDNWRVHVINRSCSNCSLSWLSFLGVGAGDPNPRTSGSGRGEWSPATVAKVTFKTEPVS